MHRCSSKSKAREEFQLELEEAPFKELVVDQEEGLEEAEGDSPLEDVDVIRDRCIVHLWMLLNLTFVTHKPYTFIFSIQHIGYACLLHICTSSIHSPYYMHM